MADEEQELIETALDRFQMLRPHPLAQGMPPDAMVPDALRQIGALWSPKRGAAPLPGKPGCSPKKSPTRAARGRKLQVHADRGRA